MRRRCLNGRRLHKRILGVPVARLGHLRLVFDWPLDIPSIDPAVNTINRLPLPQPHQQVATAEYLNATNAIRANFLREPKIQDFVSLHSIVHLKALLLLVCGREMAAIRQKGEYGTRLNKASGKLSLYPEIYSNLRRANSRINASRGLPTIPPPHLPGHPRTQAKVGA